MAKVGVILSGCGFLDGAEIREAVLTLLYLSQEGLDVVCLAPSLEQAQVINHASGQDVPEKRNVLNEAARIARGSVLNIRDANPKDFDAVILPGGYGVAKNLSNFAFLGKEARVQEDVRHFLVAFIGLKRPLGAICIAPALLALLQKELQLKPSPKITIGNDEGTASVIRDLGCDHQLRAPDEICFDENHLFVTTPAYMYEAELAPIAKGIEKLVKKISSLIKRQA